MTTIRAFICSSDGVRERRAQLLESCAAVAEEFEEDDVYLRASDWTHVTPGFGLPQALIDERIRSSDVVIVLLGATNGEYTRGELELASGLARRGDLLALLVYGYRGPDQLRQDFGPSGELGAIFAAFRGTLLYAECSQAEELRLAVRRHLRRVLAPTRHLKRIDALITRDASIIATMRVRDLRLGDAALEVNRCIATGAVSDEECRYDLNRYLEVEPALVLSGNWPDERAAHRIAHALLLEIGGGRVVCMERREFINPVHVSLAHILAELGRSDASKRERCAHQLRRWLTAEDSANSIARNFSAFVLGMTQCRDTRHALRDAVANDREHPSVRYYAAMSIGMMRTYDLVGDLVYVFDRAVDGRIKQAVGHAILEATGYLDAN